MSLDRVGLSWVTVAAAAGLGAAAAVAFFALRRVLGWLLGPIFAYETLRLARKGHTFWLRVAFALLLLALLYAARPQEDPFWNDEFPRIGIGVHRYVPDDGSADPRLAHMRMEMQRFATEFSHSFLLALAIAVTLITPLYFATAVSEEKEKRTLDFLLATQLTSRDIVLGKLAARLLNLAGVLLAGLPVLALTQLWGGVDWRLILYGFALILVVMTSYACLGLLCSAVFARTRTAVIAAYALLVVPELVLLLAGQPFSIINLLREGPVYLAGEVAPSVLEDMTFGLTGFLIVHAAVAVTSMTLAVHYLRFFAARQASRVRRALAPLRPDEPINLAVPHPLAVAPNPPLRGDPLVWKERYIGRTVGAWFLGTTFWVYAYMILGLLLVAAAVVWIEGLGGALPEFGLALRLLTVLLALLVFVSVCLRMAAAVSREREQQTLVSLLTLPVSPYRILYAKWLGTWRRARLACGGVALAFLVAALVNDSPWFCWLLFPATFMAQLWFFGNLGLFLSSVCRSTNRAYSLLLATLLLLVGGCWLAAYFEVTVAPIRRFQPVTYSDHFAYDRGWLDDHASSYVDDWLSPPQSWWRLTVPEQIPERPWLEASSPGKAVGKSFGYHFFSAFSFLVVGQFLWLSSVVVLRREGARS